MPLHVGFLGFDGANALDLIGPMEAFATANALQEGPSVPGYAVHLFGLDRSSFQCESGVTMLPGHSIDSVPKLDTLIIPGGAGLREAGTNGRVVAWVADAAPTIRRVATVCTGIYGLAPTGMLDGRRVTTHWRHAREVAARFPQLNVQADAIYIQDGRFYTSAGITAGIDLALALIAEDGGRALTLAVARDLVVYLKRDGGQVQYSEPLQWQARSGDRFAELISWMATHLADDLSVDVLASRVCLSPRHFSRRFAAELRRSPADFVNEIRLIEARRLLDQVGVTISQVATRVGFKSGEVFRRAFHRQYGLAPGDYRNRFGSSAPTPIHVKPSRDRA